MKISLFLLLLAFAACCPSCGEANMPKNASSAVKRGVAPIADPEIAVIEMENASAYGTIKMELYSNIAPKMVARFKELAREGVYDGTTFHRINQTVIQGGDPKSKDDDPSNDGTGGSGKPNIPAEFSDIPYDTGIVGAARSADINSSNSQFFIMLKREPGFDSKYIIFGKVIDGMNNVRTISGVSPKEGERPIEAVKIKSVTIRPKS
jgi:cyclophilin family peptidyl-prolyl cis-trans isomerase